MKRTPQEQRNEFMSLLHLAHEPVGVSSADHDPPAGDLSPVPSACGLWRRAERDALTAPAEAHGACRIGTHVMGFSLDGQDLHALGALVQTMTNAAYLKPDEASALPRLPVQRAWRYEPLKDADSAPDLVLLWVDARQMMLVQEALGGAHWKSGTGLQTTGRPACAALALAYRNIEPVLSFGCAGMRTFTAIPDQYMLLVVPGVLIEGLCEALSRTLSANALVQSLYDEQKAKFETEIS